MTWNRKTLALGVAGTLSWAGPAAAQERDPSQGDMGMGSSGMGSSQEQHSRMHGEDGRQGRKGQQLGSELRASMQKLHAANQAEIQLGQTARQQAQSQMVKQYAQEMVQDHRKADQRLEEFARGMKVELKGEEYRGALEESREKAKELTSKRGNEFDRAYVEHMVSDHQEDLQQVHDAAMKAGEQRHTQLAKLLGEMESRLHQHHARAQQLQQRLEQQASQGGGSSGGGMMASGPESRQGTGSGSQPDPQQSRSGQEQGSKSVVGKVQSVSGDKLSLRNELGETHDFAISNDTRFTRDGRSISKDAISEGDQVRASFRGEEGSFQATEIRVMRSDDGSGSSEGSGSSSSTKAQEDGTDPQSDGTSGSQ